MGTAARNIFRDLEFGADSGGFVDENDLLAEISQVNTVFCPYNG